MTEIPSVRYGAQRSENKRKNSFLNYKSTSCKKALQLVGLQRSIAASIRVDRSQAGIQRACKMQSGHCVPAGWLDRFSFAVRP